jgi:hypothetical protein
MDSKLNAFSPSGGALSSTDVTSRRNVFGELFLEDKAGSVFWLHTTVGKLSKIANSKAEFLEMAEASPQRREWFVEQEARAYANRGLTPNSSQCIGFGVPAVFAEGGAPDVPFIADIYEHVSFLGERHQQIATLPDRSKVRLRVGSKPFPLPVILHRAFCRQSTRYAVIFGCARNSGTVPCL